MGTKSPKLERHGSSELSLEATKEGKSWNYYKVVHANARRFGQKCMLDQHTRLLCQSARRMKSVFGGRFLGQGHAAENHKQTTKRSDKKKSIYQEDEIDWYCRIHTMNCMI